MKMASAMGQRLATASSSKSNEPSTSSSVEGPEGSFTSRFTVVKNSWKGRYTRILCISDTRLATVNPQNIFKITNSFDYRTTFVDILQDPTSPQQFLLQTMESNSKVNATSFTCSSTIERAELFTDVQRRRAQFDSGYAAKVISFPARKCSISGAERPVTLRLIPIGLEQIDANTNAKVGEYLFKNIKGISVLAEDKKSIIVAYGPQMKLHLFFLDEAAKLAVLLQDYATRFIGLPPYRAMNPLEHSQFCSDRLGARVDALEAVAEFSVLKESRKQGCIAAQRLLSTTPIFLVERDSKTYNAIGAYFLSHICALVRCQDEQRFMVEFREPHVVKEYISTQRDAVLAHLADACRHTGNHNVSVLPFPLDRGKRFCSLRTSVTEEIESALLRCILALERVENAHNVTRVVSFFNANVDYCGLSYSDNREGIFAENREKLIYKAISSLLAQFPSSTEPASLIQQFQALRRLTVSRTGFSCIAVIPTLAKAVGTTSVSALRLGDPSVTYAVVNFLNTLMTPHHNHYELEHESINKNRIAGAKGFMENLLQVLHDFIHRESASLAVQELLQLFVYILCPPYSDTTEAGTFVYIMDTLVCIVGKRLFHLMRHPCSALRIAAGQLIRVVLEEGTDEQFSLMQSWALTESGFLIQFNVAVFHRSRPLRDLARRLLALWVFRNPAMQDLLRRMLPLTLLNFLQSEKGAPSKEKELQPQKGVFEMTSSFRLARAGWFTKAFHPKSVLPKEEGSLLLPVPAGSKGEEGRDTQDITDDIDPANGRVRGRLRRLRLSSTLNWDMFFYQMQLDHLRPDLIWNHTTRTELRQAIEAELEAFEMGSDLRRERTIAWNYAEFEVIYNSLEAEVRVGHHYPRLLFDSPNPVVARPKEFLFDMYHRFLLVEDTQQKLQCLQGMALLYQHYAEEIGEFNDFTFLIRMFQSTIEPAFRDRMLLFFAAALKARHNVKAFCDANGLAPLINQVTLAQLHIDRPQVHAISHAIDGPHSLEVLQGQGKEWFYSKGGVKSEAVSYTQLKELFAAGEIASQTKVWAQGLTGWKEFHDVPQLRWGILCASKPGILTYTEVTCTILDILQSICDHYPSRDKSGAVMQPLPKVKRYLSAPHILPHLVQLLLTFDPSVCGRVHTLLYTLMEDNPLIGRFFLTGVFFFALLYPGTDVLPLARLLYLTSNRQSFQSSQFRSEKLRRSVLAPLLPPGMICHLTNHGPEKFAEVLLGEYETPEIIWGAQMRRHLAGTIAAHIADFTPRLLGNNLALFHYCPIIHVKYVALEKELFCAEYYLRHLCDELRYPLWPIRDPTSFLRDVLATWRAELDKKPSTLTRAGCLEELELQDPPDAKMVRRAYLTLAAKYHPDKNPDGREKFESIQAAYEFLAVDAPSSTEPNPANIHLLLKSQAILYKRQREGMMHYKYPGYGLLLELIRREASDPCMLTKDIVTVEPASELCFATVQNVPLNADELQEEGGIHLLAVVLERCFEVITPLSRPDDPAVKVAVNCLLTFAVSAQFTDCRTKMFTEPTIPYLSAKAIAYGELAELSRAGIQACSTQCEDSTLQAAIHHAGAIWHLLEVLFHYDPTVDTSGVPLDESHHIQLFTNRRAEYALRCICALAGLTSDGPVRRTKRNESLCSLLQKLLTPYVVSHLEHTPHFETKLLIMLNSNSETPYFLWSNSCREELLEMLRHNSQICRNARMGADDLPDLSCSDFTYTLHRGELVVGGVFVHIYTAQPHFPIDKPEELFHDLMAYLGNAVEKMNDTLHVPPSDAVAVIFAIRNLVLAYPKRISWVATKRMETLVYAINPSYPPLMSAAVELLERLAVAEACVEALGAVPVTVTALLLALHDAMEDAVRLALLQLLRVLLVSRAVVQQALDRGAYVFLLLNYASSKSNDVKEECCACLARAFGDKLFGPKIYLCCALFLPNVILDTMKENSALACLTLNTSQHNPEFVWGPENLRNLTTRLGITCEELVHTLRTNPTVVWKIPSHVQAQNPAVSELQVGGVYVSIYVQHQGWQVRKPKDFLAALLENYVQSCNQYLESLNTSAPDSKTVTVIDLLTEAGCRLLQQSPNLRNYVSSLGYMTKIVPLVSLSDRAVAVSAMRWLREIWQCTASVESCALMDVVTPLVEFQQLYPRDCDLLMETFEVLLSHATRRNRNIMTLAVQHHLVEKLLQQLEDGVIVPLEDDLSTEVPSTALQRALIIKVIKAMVALNDPTHGPALKALLVRNAVWAKYQGQSHDLFLSDGSAGRLLEMGAASAGHTFSLTMGSHSVAAPTEPPPLD